MTDRFDALRKYIRERRKMRGLDPNEIHSVHTGDEREAVLFLDDLDALLAERDALKADAELLDWADDHVLAIEHFCDVDGSYAWEVTADRPGSFIGKTPCEAIDAARNAEGKERA